MTKPYQRWTVLPHGQLSEIDDGILTVVGQIHMPLMDLPRRMNIIRLGDSRLIVWSAIALDDQAMATVEAFGRPAFLIVPSDKHRLDARVWKERYPQMQVVAPSGSRAKVDAVVPVDSTAPDFGDSRVEFVTVPGTGANEAALLVRTNHGTTLVLNDLIGNIRHASGLGGRMLRLIGFAGKTPRIPNVVKLVLIKDASALRAQLLRWAEIKSLKRILVSHGDPIEMNPQHSLRRLAGALA
ncbi:MAG: hypothetical protein ACREYB_12450 [Casimicrobiaceae bacterium]